MNPDRWRQVEGLYHAALAHPAEERAAWLAEACAGDAALQREVESLPGAALDGRRALSRDASDRCICQRSRRRRTIGARVRRDDRQPSSRAAARSPRHPRVAFLPCSPSTGAKTSRISLCSQPLRRPPEEAALGYWPSTEASGEAAGRRGNERCQLGNGTKVARQFGTGRRFSSSSVTSGAGYGDLTRLSGLDSQRTRGCDAKC